VVEPPKLGTEVEAGELGVVVGSDDVLGVVLGSDEVLGVDPVKGGVCGLVRPVDVGDGGVRLPPGIVELPVPLGP
jgi:hypothetical protein